MNNSSADVPAKHEDRIEYERLQNFNSLTAWFHSLRYKQAQRLMDELSANLGRKIRVLEVGAAQGRLFSLLDRHYDIDFTGIELKPDLCATARERHGHKPNFTLIEGSAAEARSYDGLGDIDIAFSLETLEHIPERLVVQTVDHIAKLQPSWFVASVPVEIGPAVWLKNVGSYAFGYPRYKEYTWRETLWAGLYQLDKLPPHETGHKGFDWRWLVQTIRHQFDIQELRTFPFQPLPAAVSTSVFLTAKPRSAD